MAQTSRLSTFKGVRIPNTLLENIDAYAKDHSLNTSQAIIELIGLGLLRKDERQASDNDIQDIKYDLRAIKEKLGVLEPSGGTEPQRLYGISDKSRKRFSNAYQCYAWFLDETMAIDYVNHLNRRYDGYKVIERSVILELERKRS